MALGGGQVLGVKFLNRVDIRKFIECYPLNNVITMDFTKLPYPIRVPSLIILEFVDSQVSIQKLPNDQGFVRFRIILLVYPCVT